MPSTFHDWLALPMVGLAVAIVLTVIGARLTTNSANGLLIAAWIFAGVSIFVLPFVANLDVIPRILWTALFASVTGLGLYELRWTDPIAVSSHTEPQSTAPTPIGKPSEPAPAIPSVKAIPRKATPPVVKKDTPIKPPEIVPDKPKEVIPVQPKEKIAAVLIRKYPVPPEIERYPDRFISHWIALINSVRIEGPKPNLQKVIQNYGRLRVAGPSMKELVAEATFTLRSLASEGYVRIKDAPTQGGFHGVGFDNLEFEFVPEKLNEFIEGL